MPASENTTVQAPAPQPEKARNEGQALSLNQVLGRIDRLIAVNRLTDAMNQARALFDHAVAGIPARALFALAAALADERRQAWENLKQLPAATELKQAGVLLAAGSAWFRLGEPEQAIPYLRQAQAQGPANPLVAARLGACLLGCGRADEARPLLEQAAQSLPDSGGAWLNLARAQLELGDAAAALLSLDRAAPLGDKEADKYHSTRAETLSRLGRSQEAAAGLRQALGQNVAGALQALVNLLCAEGRHDEAGHELREALQQTPDDVDLLDMAADLAQIRGRIGEAVRYLDQALEKAPDNVALWTRRATLASRRLGPEPAREAANKALELTLEQKGPNRALALSAHAQVLMEEERHVEAEAAYREALEHFPQATSALSGLGNLLLQVGRVEEATALFERLRAISPLRGWSQLIHARIVPEDDTVLAQMAQVALRPGLEGPVRSDMLFTLAAAWEKKKDYGQAWDFASRANDAAKSLLPYRPEVHRRQVEREMARFSRAFLNSRPGYGDASRLPVFVLGMPRSGTTLVEQILGSHSQVFGAGELSLVPDLIQKLNAWELKTGSRREYPECVDDMTLEESQRFAQRHLQELQAYAPEAARIVDKLPHNFEHIGLIKLLFPQAKILHLKREPRDVAMSNYFTDYAAKFGGMGFAYDLGWIGEQLADHQRLMDHWHQVFPGRILEVDYDALVEDVDGWAHKIIDYLELPWEDGVLAFQELERAVKTASVWQVRQPVYTTSKEKWRRYESHLAPLETALAEVPPMPAPLPLPRLEPGLFLRGMAHLEAGRYGEAEQDFRALVLGRSAHAAAHHFLGAALFQQNRREEARKEMRRALELQPANRQWRDNLAKVEASLGNEAEAERLRQAPEEAEAEAIA